MHVFTEFEKNGSRFVAIDGTGLPPFPNGITTLFKIPESFVALAVLHGCDPEAACRHILETVESIAIDSSDLADYKDVAPFMPIDETHAIVSGFGLTHKSKMSVDLIAAAQSGSTLPAWFFKGLGDCLRLNGEPLRSTVQPVGLCEEAEIVTVFATLADGNVRYLGYTFGNDLTDIARFKAEPKHLSYTKLSDAGIVSTGFSGPLPRTASGTSTIERNGRVVWSGSFETGLDVIAFDVETLAANIFANPTLRRPGTVHYLFLGADQSSTESSGNLSIGDRVTLSFQTHGVMLSNAIVSITEKEIREAAE